MRFWLISILILLPIIGHSQALMAYYPLNGNANDESGNGFNGIINNDPKLSIDRFGNPNSAYTFNGLDNNISVPSFPFLAEFTVAAWFRTDFSDRKMVMIDMNGFLGLEVIDGDSVSVVIRTGPGFEYKGFAAKPALLPTDNNWHLSVATYDNTTLKLYYDGQEVLSEEVAIYKDADFVDLRIGSIAGGFWWDGAVDDVRLFDRALAPSQVQLLYTENDWPLSATPTDILGFYLADQVGQAQIDPDAHTINLEALNGTDLNGLRPAIIVPPGSSVDPPAGSNEDFRDPVVYTVTASDGITEQEWQVSVQYSTRIETSTVTDIQGNEYRTVKIGNQWWMAENLRSSKYADNSDLVDGIEAGDINSDFTTKYHFPANNSSVNVPVYGYLYTWAAAMNGSTEPGAQGVCPDGWHVPTDAEFKDLERELGMSENDINALNIMRGDGIGSKLKEVANFSWDPPNPGSTNLAGFRAIPSGARNPNGSYFGFGTEFNVWTSNDFESNNQALTRKLSNDTDQIGRFIIDNDFALPVRCVNTDVVDPQVSNVYLPEFFRVRAGDVEPSVIIDDAVEMLRVSFYARRADQDNWNSFDLPLSDNGEYSVKLSEEDVTPLGLIYFFLGEDASGNMNTSDTVMITYEYLAEFSPIIQNLQAGGKANDWRMFSVPYNIVDKRIATIFEQKLGTYNKQDWRILHFDKTFSETGFREYKEGLTIIEPGKGYWFNSVEEANLQIGTSFVPKYTPFTPATLNLVAGWNQIGSPYLFDVSWQDVLDRNGLTNAQLEPLRAYYGGAGLVDEPTLKRFSGAYVHSDQARQIIIPYQVNVGGRLASGDEFENEGWLLELNLASQDFGNSLSGFGMHPLANDEHDEFDRIRVPRFGQYIDATFEHPEFTSPDFGRDVVMEQENYTWEFTVSSNVNEAVRNLSWTITNDENVKELVLVDLANGMLTDMTKTGNYSYIGSETRKFRAIYGDLAYINEQLAGKTVSLGHNYPNPFSDKTVIPYAIYGYEGELAYDIKIYSIEGKLVNYLLNDKKPAGNYQVEWDGADQSGKALKGLFIYSLEVNTPDGFKTFRNKLIVR